ncbi:MAG TPA: hypothetical protein VFU22_17080 [Roseiflexaceae bacterium]|nr:hypothetical protein [Roseiflexaceae bacterium]
MRRRALQAALASVLALTLLCGVGSFRVWSSRGWELVMRGASDVRIAHRGVARLQITYQLPAGQTRLDLRAFLMRQGWRRAEFSNVDRQTTMTFVRTSWNRQLREVLVITLDRSRRLVELHVGQCVRFGAWTTCV